MGLQTRHTRVALGGLLALAAPVSAAKYPLVDFPQLQGVCVQEVLQDSTGVIWLATDIGLWRWSNDEFVAEGHRFPTVGPPQGLLEAGGMLWVGTGDGLAGIDPVSLSLRTGPPQLRGVRVRQMRRDPLGRVWCGTTQGLYEVRMEVQPPQAQLVAGTHDRDISCLAVDSQGGLWAGTRGVLLHLEGPRLEEQFADPLGGREVSALAVAGNGTVWVGLRDPGGLYKLSEGTLTPLLPEVQDPAPQVNVILAHPNGEMWVGTDEGVLRWTGAEFLHVDHETGLVQEAVRDLYVDHEELVWMATCGGLYQLRSPFVLTYDVYDGLPHPVVQVVLPRTQEEFVVGTAGGLCRMNLRGDVLQELRNPGDVQALCADPTGRLWVGGQNGLACFEETRGKRVDLPDARALRGVKAIGRDPQGGIWVCTASGLWYVLGSRLVRIPLPADYSESDTRFAGMYVGPQGVIHLATRTGMLVCRPFSPPYSWALKLYRILHTGLWACRPLAAVCLQGAEQELSRRTGLVLQGAGGRWSFVFTGREVECLVTDTHGGLWIGTSQGLMMLLGGFCRDFSRRGAPHGKVSDLSVDDRGRLWLATPEGLYRYDGNHFAVFTRADGLPSDDVRCVQAFAPGVVLVGTARGLARIESDRLSPARGAPGAIITAFRAGGEQYVPGDAPLRVPNWQRNVSISFQGSGFRHDPKTLRYRSRLVGFEVEWSAPSPEPARSYSNLPAGRYEFQVKAVHPQGIESERAASVSFRVGPPVWLDPWFVAGCTLALSALGAWVFVTQRNKRQLQQAAAAATIAKNEFLAKVSHEIRTPLTVILSCIERLGERREPLPVADDILDAIRRNSHHLLGLINDLLDLSKIETGHLQVKLAPASVHDLLMGVEAIMRVGAEEHGLHFRITYETPIPERIVTDVGRLRQALINLVGNAIKFTPQGWIHLRVSVEQLPGGRWLLFDVEDTGVGVPPEKLDVIFEAFSQVESLTSRRHTGTGLGLAISKSIAECLFGRLTVRSQVGKGSTFTLSIDLSRAGVETLGMETRMVPPSELAAARMQEGHAAVGGDGEGPTPRLSGHVLLAEDAQDISNIMRLQLESAGAEVTVIDNGLDAVEMAYDGRFDAIIMDIHMPGMDGIDAIREIRTRGLETPIIVISADSSEERYRACREAGANGFVPKPFQKAVFLDEVRRHLKLPPEPAKDRAAAPIRSELDLSSPRMAAAVALFVQTLEERVRQLETAFEQGDTETLCLFVHQLKGAGGIHGYMSISEQARKIEEAIRLGDTAGVREALQTLSCLRDRIVAGLRSDRISAEA